MRSIEGSLNIDLAQVRLYRNLLRTSGLYFSRYFFNVREAEKFIVSDHHKIISQVVDDILNLRRTRVIINIPPGYTKTEEVVINLISRGFAINPRAKFIHTTYGDTLALQNSSKIRDTIESDEYQQLWPMQIRADTKAKKLWKNQYDGGMLASSIEGQILGFRAGKMDKDKFTGVFSIDDPIKPMDAYSQVKRDKNNAAYNTLVKSRLAVEDVPVVLIMQRCHEEDMTGFLLNGGSGEVWDHLMLPVEINDRTRAAVKKYQESCTHCNPIEWDLPDGPLWEYKHNAEQIDILRVDEYVFAAQYIQIPAPLGGAIFKSIWWKHYTRPRNDDDTVDYDTLPGGVEIVSRVIFGDTASKTKTHNDYSVFQIWALGSDDRIYLLDQIRGKWEAPDLVSKFVVFCSKHKFKTRNRKSMLREAWIEDASSGTGLMQTINKNYPDNGITLVEITRVRDKVSRAIACTTMLAYGKVVIPCDAPWILDYEEEFEKFTATMAHKHDDQIDPTMDAIENLLIFEQKKVRIRIG